MKPALQRLVPCVLAACCASVDATAADAPATCERWGVYEVELKGPSDGNPFLGVELTADFSREGRTVRVTGFYDGEGVYRVRFSPDEVGEWTYATHSNAAALDGKRGRFGATPPGPDNHGPVRVARTFHLDYADGTAYKPVGTTCYAWTSQPESLQEQTLKTLAASPFNKLRMCVFPKRYKWNENEPPAYAYEGTAPDQWDLSRFNPSFFRALERRVAQLGEMGIQADIILLHPYDEGHWGFDRMSDAADDFYLRYVVSRLAAYRHVWWSMANEWDFMTKKDRADWERMIRVVADADPYDRMLGIHNGYEYHNHNNPLLTHASIQNGSAAEDAGRASLLRDAYNKPILLDEVKYEGDIPSRWGNLSAQEMVHRFWQGTIAGCYVTHGECYLAEDDVLWWAKGGVLKGESPARIAFLKGVIDAAPATGINLIDKWQHTNIAGKPAEYYLVYFGASAPGSWEFSLPKHELTNGMRFKVETLDTWNMKVEPVEGEFVTKQQGDYVFKDAGGRKVELPGRPWMALRVTRVREG